MASKRDRSAASSDSEEGRQKRAKPDNRRVVPITDYRKYVAEILQKASRRGPRVSHPESQLVFGKLGDPITCKLYKIQIGGLKKAGLYAHIAESRMALFAKVIGFRPAEPLVYDVPKVADKILVANEAEWSILLEALQDFGVPKTPHCTDGAYYMYFYQGQSRQQPLHLR